MRHPAVPLVLDSGRWVLSWARFYLIGGTAIDEDIGVFTSDDQGATWVLRMSERGFAFATWGASTGLVEAPDGDLWYAAMQETNAQDISVSSDGGTTWVTTEGLPWSSGESKFWVPLFSDGSQVWGIYSHGTSATYEWRYATDPLTLPTPTGRAGFPPPVDFTARHRLAAHPLERALYVFIRNRVARVPLGAGWLIDRIGFS